MNRLVIVFLRGAADGLTILTPPDPQYRQFRPDLATPEAQLLPLDEGWGMHPNLAALHRRVLGNSATIVPAVGLGDGNRSHFSAQHNVEVGASTSGTGWVGRHLALSNKGEPNPFRGVSLGAASLPAMLRGTRDALTATSLASLRLGAPIRKSGRPRRQRATLDASWFSTPWAGFADNGPAADVTMVSTIQSQLAALASTEPASAPAEDEESGAATSGFAAASQVLSAGLGTEVVVLNLGGWDTHNEQGVGTDGLLPRLLADLDRGVDNLLTTHEKDIDPVNVLIISEFGRRVAQNSSLGTDHGSGGVAILAGPAAAGGRRGEWPGLADLVDGDVRAANPTGAILAEVATKILKTPDATEVVPGVDQSDYLGVCR